MSHKMISIKASPKQLSKLRNGHKVRIVQGEGFNLLIDPSKYDIVTKNFLRGKGSVIQLNPTEIVANQEAQMQGLGIFGDKFDRYLEKKGVKKIAYKLGDTLKPVVKAGILGGLASGATALAGLDVVASGGLGASAIPLIYGTAGSLGMVATDYLDNPKKYNNNIGGPKSKISANSLEGQAYINSHIDALNQHTGNKYNALYDANLHNAIANKDSGQLINAGLTQLHNSYNMSPNVTNFTPSTPPIPVNETSIASLFPKSAFEGRGIHKHKIHHRPNRELSSIGPKGALAITAPPALMSQPFGINYQFKHTLPPAYQHF